MNTVFKLFTIPGMALLAASAAVPALAGSRAGTPYSGHGQAVVDPVAAADNPEGLRSAQDGSGMRAWWSQQYTTMAPEPRAIATTPAAGKAPKS